MNAKIHSQLVVMVLVALASSTALAKEPEPPVAVKTDGLSPYLAATVEEKAAQGFSALRRYVIRTRMIHALDLNTLVREEPSQAVAQKPTEKAPQIAATERPAR